MTHSEILSMQPGAEFDAAIHQAMGKKCRYVGGYYAANGVWLVGYWIDEKTGRPPPRYSTSIADAWTLFQSQTEKLFSQRRRFLDALQEVAASKMASGHAPAWPDVLVVLKHCMPEAICIAALLAMEDEHAQL